MALEFDRSIIGQVFDETSFPPVTKEEILEFAMNSLNKRLRAIGNNLAAQ